MAKEKVKWTALKVKRRLRDYIAECEANEYCPTDYDIIKLFGISARQLDYWVQGGKTERADYSEFAPVMKELVLYREHCFVRQMAEGDPRRITGIIFQMKQKKNGGYADKPEIQTGNIQIDVKLQGGGDNPFG